MFDVLIKKAEIFGGKHQNTEIFLLSVDENPYFVDIR